jgi:iron complex transport system substrate-binding protein
MLGEITFVNLPRLSEIQEIQLLARTPAAGKINRGNNRAEGIGARVKRIVLLMTAACVVIVLTACGSDDTDDAGATTPAPTATEAPGTPEPEAEASGETDSPYPIMVRDLMGRQVTIESAPERIITTSPSAIELLYAAGGTAIGRSSTALGVPGAEDLVDVGPSYEPAFEVIIQQQPDLVIADVSAQAHLAGAFEQALAGTPILFVGALQYADIATSIRLLGDVIGDPEAAAAAAADVEAASADVAALVAQHDPVPALVLVAGRDGGMSAALEDSFVGDMLRIAGGDNVAADLPQSGQVPGYALLSLETVIADDPEVIMVIVPGQMGGGPSMAAVIAQQFPTLTAVQSGRVHEIDLETYLQVPGPRAVQGLRELAALLHPAG